MRNKLLVIILFELKRRLKKTSFWLLAILLPIITMSGLFGFISYSLLQSAPLKVAVIDEKQPLYASLSSSKLLSIAYLPLNDLSQSDSILNEADFDAILYIPYNLEFSNTAMLYWQKKPSNEQLRMLERQLQDQLEIYKLEGLNISKRDYNQLRAPLYIKSLAIDDSGEAIDYTNERQLVGGIFVLALFVLLISSGGFILKSIIDEKSNRIAEILLSSVSSTTLLFGKIIGAWLASLIQIFIWILLIGLFAFTCWLFDPLKTSLLPVDYSSTLNSKSHLVSIWFISDILSRTNLGLMAPLCFLLFTGGYWLYSGLNAIIGVFIPIESETKSWSQLANSMLWVALGIAVLIIVYPEQSHFDWAIYIPFFSPLVIAALTVLGKLNAANLIYSLIILYSSVFIAMALAAHLHYKYLISGVYQIKSKKRLWRK